MIDYKPPRTDAARVSEAWIAGSIPAGGTKFQACSTLVQDIRQIVEELKSWLASEEGACAFRENLQRIHEMVEVLRVDRMLDQDTIERPMTL